MKHDKQIQAWPFPTRGYEDRCEVKPTTDDYMDTARDYTYVDGEGWTHFVIRDPTEPVVKLTDEQKQQLKEVDPSGLDLNTPGAKADAGKNRVWLFMAGFSNALEEVSRVTTVGAIKYTPNGWVDVSDGTNRYMDAFGRHMLELGKGAVLDDGPKGTGCMHKAAMIWNLLASFELELRSEK